MERAALDPSAPTVTPSGDPMLKVRVEESRSFTKTVHLEGRLDNETVAILDRELDRLLGSPVRVLVFDFAGLEYISSAGLRSIFAAQKSMRARAGTTLLLDPRPAVRKVLDIVKAVDVSEVFSSVAELDAYLDAMQKKITEGDPGA